MDNTNKETSSLMTKTDEKKFNSEEVTTLIKEAIGEIVADSEYSYSKVSHWNSTIIKTCLNKLKSMNNNYKYIITCVILQNKGAGFYASSSAYWDNQNDGSASYCYESKSLHVIVNVFALKI
ncbi:Tctex-1 [Cokeromyces recurvatus]|uniref:Tctex-1 n=1 Tax=Cokeromyces recurvatus TaxID=90255 RepID=UPI00221FF8A8|nr:Tctex-1 [Cokeromyces recurvatus]KAI7904654.1 Tctex-1 [Cokeromyces recurvatus]